MGCSSSAVSSTDAWPAPRDPWQRWSAADKSDSARANTAVAAREQLLAQFFPRDALRQGMALVMGDQRPADGIFSCAKIDDATTTSPARTASLAATSAFAGHPRPGSTPAREVIAVSAGCASRVVNHTARRAVGFDAIARAGSNISWRHPSAPPPRGSRCAADADRESVRRQSSRPASRRRM